MARPLAARSLRWLTTGVAFALLAVACTSVPPRSSEATVVPASSASPTIGPRTSPGNDTLEPTAAAAVGGPGDQVRWSRVVTPFGDPSDAKRIDGVVEWRSRLVAFGRVKARGRSPQSELAAVFLSDTGETWRTVPITAGVASQDTSEINLLAAGPRGAAAFGGTCCAVEEQAIWYSPSGESWERVALEPSVFNDSQIAAARASGNAFVAVGSRSGRAAIWTSSDGRAWTAVGSAAAGLGSGAIGDVALVAGRWLAVGFQDDGNTYDGAFWESADGVGWQRLPTDRLFQGELDTTVERLYPTPDGVLLIGRDGPHNERLRCEQLAGRTASLAAVVRPDTAISCGWGVETHWWSPDGRTWERLPPVVSRFAQSPLPGPGPNEFRLITTGGPGLLNLDEDRSGVVRLWESRDGRDWQERGTIATLRSGQDSPTGIAVLNGRVIAVGEAWDGSSGQPGEPAVWLGLGL